MKKAILLLIIFSINTNATYAANQCNNADLAPVKTLYSLVITYLKHTPLTNKSTVFDLFDGLVAPLDRVKVNGGLVGRALSFLKGFGGQTINYYRYENKSKKNLLASATLYSKRSMSLVVYQNSQESIKWERVKNRRGQAKITMYTRNPDYQQFFQGNFDEDQSEPWIYFCELNK